MKPNTRCLARKTPPATSAGGPGTHIHAIPGEILLFLLRKPIFLPFPFFFSRIPLTFAALISFFMLAVVKIAGQQFKVQKDQTLYVPRLAGNAGDKVEFGEVLLSYSSEGSDKLSVGKDVKAVIKAEIVGHVQGDKVIAFKMKRRKGFRKKHGHRTHYTKIHISEIA
jgi:large subunit ribosomal protein L21